MRTMKSEPEKILDNLSYYEKTIKAETAKLAYLSECIADTLKTMQSIKRVIVRLEAEKSRDERKLRELNEED